MSTSIVHPKVLDNGEFDASNFEVITCIENSFDLEKYFIEKLHKPSMSVYREVNEDFADKITKRIANPFDWYLTKFYEDVNYQGRCFTLNNFSSVYAYDTNLKDNKLNDKVSSIHVGRAIICVLIAQHKFFGGAKTWLVGKTISGEGPSKLDLTQLPCPAGDNWNDRISSVASFTIDPVSAARLISNIFGIFI